MLGVNTISVLGVETQDYLSQQQTIRTIPTEVLYIKIIGIYYCDYVDFKILILIDIGNFNGLIFKKLINQIKY